VKGDIFLSIWNFCHWLTPTCSSQQVMLFKATGSDLILHRSHWFTSGPSPHHPIISHWRFFHGLFLSLEEGSSSDIPVDHTVQRHIAPDSSVRSNGCENLHVTWLMCYSWVPQTSHHQHTTAQAPKLYVISIWQLSPSTLTFSIYDCWVPQASHDQHTTVQVPRPHNISIWVAESLKPNSVPPYFLRVC